MPLPSSTIVLGSEPARRQVVLSFEQTGTPQPDRAARILDSLDQFGARAVFFVTGESARTNPALLKMIAERQHQLGSLGWDERDLENIPVRDSEDALARAQAEVAVASGAPVTLFRNPLGSNPGDSAGSGMPNMVEEFVIGRQQMHLVPADFNSDDWKTTDPVKLFHNATAMLDERNGGIISFRADLEQTAIILPHFLEELRTQGYSVATYTQP
jgi:peptidoglycan/xylan/chitin deacetylase (PgdA/CDA1 family)